MPKKKSGPAAIAEPGENPPHTEEYIDLVFVGIKRLAEQYQLRREEKYPSLEGPMPPEEKDFVVEILSRINQGTKIIRDSIYYYHRELQQVVIRHEAELQRRWKKEKDKDRRNTLGKCFPGMPVMSRPDCYWRFQLDTQKATWDQIADKHEEWLLPDINKSDLPEGRRLLVLIHARARNSPWEFAYIDRYLMTAALEIEALDLYGETLDNEFYLMRMEVMTEQDAMSYGQLWSRAEREAAGFTNYTGFTINHGFWILRAQERLHRLLLQWTTRILGKKGLLAAAVIPEPPAMDAKAEDEDGVLEFGPWHEKRYEAPRKIPDLPMISAFVQGQLHAWKGHIVRLKTDPSYFAEQLARIEGHLWENVPDAQSRRAAPDCQVIAGDAGYTISLYILIWEACSFYEWYALLSYWAEKAQHMGYVYCNQVFTAEDFGERLGEFYEGRPLVDALDQSKRLEDAAERDLAALYYVLLFVLFKEFERLRCIYYMPEIRQYYQRGENRDDITRRDVLKAEEERAAAEAANAQIAAETTAAALTAAALHLLRQEDGDDDQAASVTASTLATTTAGKKKRKRPNKKKNSAPVEIEKTSSEVPQHIQDFLAQVDRAVVLVQTEDLVEKLNVETPYQWTINADRLNRALDLDKVKESLTNSARNVIGDLSVMAECLDELDSYVPYTFGMQEHVLEWAAATEEEQEMEAEEQEREATEEDPRWVGPRENSEDSEMDIYRFCKFLLDPGNVRMARAIHRSRRFVHPDFTYPHPSITGEDYTAETVETLRTAEQDLDYIWSCITDQVDDESSAATLERLAESGLEKEPATDPPRTPPRNPPRSPPRTPHRVGQPDPDDSASSDEDPEKYFWIDAPFWKLIVSGTPDYEFRTKSWDEIKAARAESKRQGKKKDKGKGVDKGKAVDRGDEVDTAISQFHSLSISPRKTGRKVVALMHDTKKTKEKTRGTADETEEAAPEEQEPPPPPPRRVYRVNQATLAVFQVLLFTPGRGIGGGELKWRDFRRALGSLGFGFVNIDGSEVRIIPPPTIPGGSMVVHKPHGNPPDAWRWREARMTGWRLARHYDWRSEDFVLDE